jgi:hypothetical protein
VVEAKGFEPSTSWSRNRVTKILNALSGVAYGIQNLISPLLVVANLYLNARWFGNGFEARAKIGAIRFLRSFQFWRAPGWAESKADISRGTILVR